MSNGIPKPIIRLACLFCLIDRDSVGVEEAIVATGLKRLDMGFKDVSERVSVYTAKISKFPRDEFTEAFTGAVYQVYEEYGDGKLSKFFSLLCDIAFADRNPHITELRELDRIADLWGIPFREREEIVKESKRKYNK
ncbi:MAG: hypothetical protein GY771_10880 [bacterium]|nr:hypothetical protein [bacterium]